MPFQPTSRRSILYYSPIYAWVFQVVSSLRFTHRKPVRISPLPYTCYMSYVSHSSWFDHSTKVWWAHKALCHIVSSTPLLPHPSQAQISSSAPCFRKPSAYVPASVSATHLKQQAKQDTLKTYVDGVEKCVCFTLRSTKACNLSRMLRVVWAQIASGLLETKVQKAVFRADRGGKI